MAKLNIHRSNNHHHHLFLYNNNHQRGITTMISMAISHMSRKLKSSSNLLIVVGLFVCQFNTSLVTSFHSVPHHGFLPKVHRLSTTTTTSQLLKYQPNIVNTQSVFRNNDIFSHVIKSPFELYASNKNDNITTLNDNDNDPTFDAKTTATLIFYQSLLVVAAIIASSILHVPNFGLGPGFQLSSDAVIAGFKTTIPLFSIAAFLDQFENKVPALANVSKATQRSVLALIGGKRKPVIGAIVALSLGIAAGLGEEMVFRGILQSELVEKFDGSTSLALVSSSIIFGALHAITPLYAALATLASFYFGYLYIEYDNLLVPIICHAFYDFGALLWAHYVVSGMSQSEQLELSNWDPNKLPSSSS